MDIPFKVEFIQYSNIAKVMKFARTEEELFKLNDDEIPALKENITLSLLFTSTNSEDKLYFDLLDIVYKNERYDELNYLLPCEEPIKIYDSEETYTGALIPGYYKITVTHKNTNFYSWLKISPKQVTEEQWITMREEIEIELTGLARDVLYKRTGTQLKEDALLPLSLLNQIELINVNYSKWKLAKQRVLENPRYRIKKEYSRVDKSEAKLIDHISIRKMNFDILTSSKGQVYSAENTCAYDTLENRWIKFYVSEIYKKITILYRELDVYFTEIDITIANKTKYGNGFSKDLHFHKLLTAKEELQVHRYKLSSIIFDCHQFFNTPWVKEISEYLPQYPSMTIQSDNNYRTIYKLYKDLMIENYEIKFASDYTYYWKRTDQLYEIWGFIQFVKAITSEAIGFEVNNGWIYSVNTSANRIFEIPFLKQGTTVEFVKDDIQVNLVYDAVISNTDDTDLLYTYFEERRPDLRLDFFKDGEYINSIIADFKYRPLKYIWPVSGSKLTDVKEQLLAYRHNFQSKQIFAKMFPGNWRNMQPVSEVWAVYPQHESNKKNNIESRQIRLVELTPKIEKNLFVNNLKESIDNVLRTWNTFRNNS